MLKNKYQMETLILEVNESDKNVFIELAKKLKTKYEVINQLNQVEEEEAIYLSIKEGQKEGIMNETEKASFLRKIGL